MCGIAGAFAPGEFPDPGAVAARLAAMTAAVAHRGPDDCGTWHDDHAGLGTARLAIIDLSHAGHQPMTDGERSLHIAFNGEVYNHPELRRTLEARGHRFRSRTDTEVVLYGYREWGDAVLERLRGMFAFAIWDAPRRRLLLARDRIGQKPLYYAWHEGTLVFGSEIKALLTWAGMPREPDYRAIHDFLGFRYVPGTRTAFAGVSRLAPAHSLTVSADRPAADVRRYWDLPRPEPARAGARRRDPDLPARILERFDEAVRLRMAADVPVGAFLSGGIDSSAVVASMAAASTAPVRTFTVGFEDASIDERAPARAVADRYATIHTEIDAVVDLPSLVPRIVWHYGEPYADPVAIPTYLLAEAARAHVKVVLTGDGGDETFFGYRRHVAMRVASWLDAAPSPVRRAIAGAARRAGRRGKASRFASELDRRPVERYARWVTYLSDDLKAELYDGPLEPYAAERAAELLEPWFATAGRPEVQAADADLQTFLPDDLLVRLDVATMAHGLEARSPFLDHELVELALSIPARVRLPGVRTKGLLRDVLADRLPAALRRRPKLGFPMPLGLRRPAAAEMVRDALSARSVGDRGILRPQVVGGMVARHYAGEADLEHELWQLLMLELWFRMWIDGRPPPGPPF